MPRTSKRKYTLKIFQWTLVSRRHSPSVRYLFGDDDCFEDEMDEQLELLHEQVNSTRYTFLSNKYRKRKDRWNTFLDANGEFNDEEFIGHFRMHFAALVNLILFSNLKANENFVVVPHIAHILLKFFGSFGKKNTSPKLAHFFGLGKGSVKNYTARFSLWNSYLKGMEKTIFRGKVVIFSMTSLFVMMKGGYSLNDLIICDDVARIMDFVVGWSGSVNDNRVWTTSTIYRNPDTFFAHNQYLLGDPAFQLSPNMIPAFKNNQEVISMLTANSSKPNKARIKT
ncbi:LOW QUALITY PROTEIN: hypothetical protein PHMEG_00027360 [Phytophthora megakarya]|uniref:DDE Tnp4 domain-containing protein n=1 Tax=Phytophthora megakarya TaxID=4795 RepID=A0A225V5Z1_9STRA|nr:LOW QUALITY PROTEIN: hypothetical protein PHMEG_00027360 [Phytophthora megakarya]